MPEPRLHAWWIDPAQYARHEARRGRRHAFTHLEPVRTALVVVDMVDFFVAESGYCQGIVPNINRLADALRDAGGTVAWVVPAAGAGSPAWREFYGPQIADRYASSGGVGPLPGRLWCGLHAVPDDVYAEKSASSAFFPGRCPLPERLADKGIDTVLVTGTVTNVCCESTVRDAQTLGYRVIMVADGNAAARDQDHNATLHTVYRSFGDVRPTTDVLQLIGASVGFDA